MKLSGAVAAALWLPTWFAPTFAQSLDHAVQAQLEAVDIDPDPNIDVSVACARLRNLTNTDPNDDGSLSDLDQGLQTICTHGSLAGDASSVGGGAGTAAAIPSGMRRRIDEEHTPGEQAPARGVFATVSTGVDDRAVTNFQDGYQGDAIGLLGGLDRQLGPWLAGITLEYWRHEGKFASGGNFETTALGLTVFGARALSERADIAVYGGFNTVSNERLRVTTYRPAQDISPLAFTGTPAADFDATEQLAGAQLTFHVPAGPVTLHPVFSLDWRETEFDSYAETEQVVAPAGIDSGLALVFYDDKRTSFLSTVGIDVSLSISTDFGVVVLSEHIYYKHEHDDEQRNVAVSFVDDTRAQRFQYQTEPPDPDHFEVGLDAIFVLQGGLQAFVAYEQIASHRFLDTSLLSGGFRKEF